MGEFDMGLVQRGARNRRTPYYEATQRSSPKGFTVYNHMYFPIRFDTFEAEFEALLNDVTIWDVAVEREFDFVLVQNVEQNHFVSAEPQVPQRRENGLQFFEAIGD